MLQKLANAEVDFLQKPFLPHELAEKARLVLERE
jgi:DNA-binding response OmpR family regulator